MSKQQNWRPISEIHEDFGACILVHANDWAYMQIGSNLDSWFNFADWTHFCPIPDIDIDGETLKAQLQLHETTYGEMR